MVTFIVAVLMIAVAVQSPCFGQGILRHIDENRGYNIAVMDLVPKGIGDDEASILSDKLRNEIVNCGKYSVFERSELRDVLKEQGLQQSGCFEDSCVVAVGRLIGVQKIVTGTIGKIGRSYSISCRLIDVETGRIDQTADQAFQGTVEFVLVEGMKSIAARLTVERPVAELGRTSSYWTTKAQETINMNDKLQFANKAIELDPNNNAAAYAQRAIAFHDLGESDKAIADITTAINIMPKLPAGYYIRADTYYNAKRFRSALNDYSSYLSLSPDSQSIRIMIAFCYGMIGDNSSAVAELIKWLAVASPTTTAYYRSPAWINVHLAYFTATNDEITKDSYDYAMRSLKYDPCNPLALFIVARYFARTANHQLARTYFVRADSVAKSPKYRREFAQRSASIHDMIDRSAHHFEYANRIDDYYWKAVENYSTGNLEAAYVDLFYYSENAEADFKHKDTDTLLREIRAKLGR